jgi:uncharacterized protein
MLTGPLPELVDHRKLANRAGIIEGVMPVSRLSRLVEILSDTVGEVRVKLEFRQSDFRGTHVIGESTANVALICQNCLKQFIYELECEVSTAIVSDEALIDEVEQVDDFIVVKDKLVAVIDLVEDQLILAVPMIARHPEDCPENEFLQHDLLSEGSVEVVEDENEENETYRPFADLAKAIDKHNKPES